MRYYQVFAAEVSYQKTEPLTYCSEEALEAGAIIEVPYGRKVVAGIIVQEVEEPSFATKSIVGRLAETLLPLSSLQLLEWLLTYYPGGSGAAAQLFVPSGLGVRARKQTSPKAQPVPPSLPALTPDQQTVIKAMNDSARKTFMLHGETGSGKTRIYLERTLKALKSGRSALILTPEISLVPQLADTFTTYFGDKVITLHSGLTKATRNRHWLRVLNATEPIVVIGTRSALFAPVKNIGFIGVDEMHEPAYKQESAPRYYALRVAAQAAKLHEAEIIYGSATPSIVEYFLATKNEVPILRMAKPAKALAGSVERTVIDLKDKTQFSRHPYLSDHLLKSIENRLQTNEQSLLFLNRRGTARQILCQNCGWQAMCPNCDTPLVYHGDRHLMRCHTCGHKQTPPYTCPECGSDKIIYRSLGTKALVETLQGLFPHASIRRFDTDNLADEQLDKHFEAVKAGEVDILVGTQMLGKGLDLPKLSLVAIVNADTSLNTPDFSASERSYQLLHQAIGRVGRGHIGGEVILQSFNPSNPLLQAALNQNWQELYAQEIKERQQFTFPPFCFMLKITVSRRTNSSAEQFIRKLHDAIRGLGLKVQVNEPVPSFHERTHGQYNWQLVIKAKDRGRLTKIVQDLPKGDWTYDLDPINLL